MRRGFLVCFVIVCVLHLAAILAGAVRVELVTKPLIVFSLLGYYGVNALRRSVTFILALIFCWIGDTVLLFQATNELFFMAGLGSFLLAHIFYIITYRRHSYVRPLTESIATHKWRLAFPVILAGTGLVIVLYPYLGTLMLPVLAYALVLTIMTLTAVMRYGRTNHPSFWLVFFGALFFMASDSILAINKFMSPIGNGAFVIMLTYCAAQFLIVEGILRHTEGIEDN